MCNLEKQSRAKKLKKKNKKVWQMTLYFEKKKYNEAKE